jgi:hypothetical protein
MKEIKAFECGYCRKMYRTESGVLKHEKFCNSNPQNYRACDGCAFLKTEIEEYEKGDDYTTDEPVMGKRRVFECTKLNKTLYSVYEERKGHLEQYPWHFNNAIRMPKTCIEYKPSFSI